MDEITYKLENAINELSNIDVRYVGSQAKIYNVTDTLREVLRAVDAERIKHGQRI